MPTVLRIGPYRFGFYALDRGEPPHVHVRRDRAHAKLWLGPVRVEYNRGFAEVELRRAMNIAEQHEALLLARWREFFGDDN